MRNNPHLSSPTSAVRSWLGALLTAVSVLALTTTSALAIASPASAAAPKPAKLSISPASHQYGSVVLGAASTGQTFTVTNTGQSASGPLMTAITGTAATDYAIDASTCTGALAARSACAVTVHFAPASEGSRPASLAVTGTPGGTVKATLQGTGTTAHLVLSPGTHQYGSVTLGASSARQTYTVTNTGAAPSGPVSVTFTGANTADFVQVASTCASPIPAGSSCAVDVVFTPTAAGARTATMSAVASPGGSVSATMHGTGAAKALLAISPSTFDYGQVVVGSSAGVQTYTVTNTGVAKSGVVTVAVGGTDPAAFPQNSTTCGAKLDVRASCTVSVRFTPSGTGVDTAALSVTASPGGTATASLTGTGITPAALSITPTTFDYGTAATGAASAAQSFTVTNTGQGSSGPAAVTLSGADPTSFAVTGTTCGASLAGGGSCTVSVRYAPASTGAATATLSVAASPGGTASASLRGTGITPAVLSISPTTFDFGSVLAGATSTGQTFTVMNTGQGASGPVSVTSTGSDSAAFVVDNTTCGAALSGGDTCVVIVHFAPTAPGALTASLSATSTTGGAAASALHGTGLAPATLSISPTPFDFGQTPIGVTTAAAPFTVTNTGQGPSGTVAVALSGPSAASFTIVSSTCGSALAPGGSCAVRVTFGSFSTGGYTAGLSATATPGGSATAALTAQAITPAFFHNNSTVDFGQALVGSSTSTQTITVTNFGQQTTGPLNVVLSGTDAGDFAVDADTCTGVLVGGAACAVTVHFSPTALGGRTATVKVSANPGGIQTNILQGTGVNVVTVNPSAFTFPDQFVGTTSGATDFVLTNYGTTVLTSFTITASDAVDLPVTADTCAGATVAPGASCTISVAFNAAVLGQHTSTMNVSLTDAGNVAHSASFQATGTSIVPPPDLSTSMTVLSRSFSNASVQITVSNLGSAPSSAATMTIDVDPTQSFSYSAGAGTDCTATFVNSFDSRLTCPVPVIAVGGTYTRTLTESNLSSQAPHYIQNQATTTMPGDTNSGNDTAYAFVTFN